MAENKTKPNDASVEQYFAAIDDDLRRKECEGLAKIMTRATKLKPKMWGAAIVGSEATRISTRAVARAKPVWSVGRDCSMKDALRLLCIS